jgi:hypothetical protein
MSKLDAIVDRWTKEGEVFMDEEVEIKTLLGRELNVPDDEPDLIKLVYVLMSLRIQWMMDGIPPLDMPIYFFLMGMGFQRIRAEIDEESLG